MSFLQLALLRYFDYFWLLKDSSSRLFRSRTVDVCFQTTENRDVRRMEKSYQGGLWEEVWKNAGEI